ncbi:MAG: ABC transporter ATP-binding protein [Alphaproteobacteria bacterium]|nr:ABC transporter ATP-binding protein [Alphaproteobacteria bacterium]
MSAPTAAITIAGVTRRYGARLALDDVSLALPAGRITALLGASGSGKSTLLRLIAGLEPVDAGEIRLGEARVSAPGVTTPPELRRVGMVFQDFALFPHLSAADNVAFGLKDRPKPERRAEAMRLLDLVGLAGRADAFPHMLSGGEQQRVALARALAPRPRALLLDEPFSGLDPGLRAELRETTLTVLREAGATAVFVTHDADEALYVADLLAILKDGRVLQLDTPRAVYDTPACAAAAAALGPINVLRTQVKAGIAQTPFGAIDAAGCADGPADVVVRAEALRSIATPAGTGTAVARVIDRRPQGAVDLVRLESQGVTWRGAVDPASPLAIGAATAVAFGPRGVHCFPVSGG